MKIIINVFLFVFLVSCFPKNEKNKEYQSKAVVLLTNDTVLVLDRDLDECSFGDSVVLQRPSSFDYFLLSNYPFQYDTILEFGFGSKMYIFEAVIIEQPYLKQ